MRFHEFQYRISLIVLMTAYFFVGGCWIGRVGGCGCVRENFARYVRFLFIRFAFKR